MDNSFINDREYNQGKVILESSPKTVFIQAAGPCDSRCVFCSREKEYEFFDLSLHRERFAKCLYDYINKAETLVLTGSGEFLLLPDAQEILDFFDTAFPRTEKFFSTNGSPLSPAASERIVNGKSNFTLHISLHASNASLHKVMTRTDNFQRILGQVRHLLKMRKDQSRIRVNLVFVATTLNIDDLPDFVRLCADLGADKAVCYYNYIYIPTQKYLSCFFKQELTNRMFDRAEELAEKLGVKIDLPARFGQGEYPKLNVCREPFSQIMFDSQGKALPCDASEDCREVLREDRGFMDIWNSGYYQKLRKGVLEKNAPCFNHCLRANPACVNDFKSHVIHRGRKDEDIHILWGDNF